MFFWNTVYIPVAPVAVPDTAAERGRSLNAVRQALPDAALPGGRRRLPRRLAAGLSLGVVTALSVDDSQAAGSHTACRVFWSDLILVRRPVRRCDAEWRVAENKRTRNEPATVSTLRCLLSHAGSDSKLMTVGSCSCYLRVVHWLFFTLSHNSLKNFLVCFRTSFCWTALADHGPIDLSCWSVYLKTNLPADVTFSCISLHVRWNTAINFSHKKFHK